MKPRRSTMRRWLLAAQLLRWAALVVLVCGVAALAISLVPDVKGNGSSDASAANSKAGGNEGPSSRPSLIQAIGDRSIRYRLTSRPPPEAPPVEVASVGTVTPSGPPPFELVATFTAPGGEATAYVRRIGDPDIVAWTGGSKEGPFVVEKIGEGWVTLQTENGRHTIRVAKRKP